MKTSIREYSGTGEVKIVRHDNGRLCLEARAYTETGISLVHIDLVDVTNTIWQMLPTLFEKPLVT